MSKTKKPEIGGILTIFSGILGLLGTASYTIGLGEAGSGFGKGDMPLFVPSIIFGLSLPAVAIALLAIAGGILALLRKRWRWSLAGSIAAALSLILLGIPAIVLIALSQDEFASSKKVN
ncbi:hypothetical protein ACFLWN_04565 [Chloroflexota bacterium]